MTRVLIVDDEPSIAWALREALMEEGYDVASSASAEDALQQIERTSPDLVMLDVRLPGRDGLSTLERLKQSHHNLPVIIMTAFGNLETAVRAVRHGAYDYLTKPFDLESAIALVHRALQSPLAGENVGIDQPVAQGDDQQPQVLLGHSPQMQEIFRKIALLAGHDVPVLITGESGTGKEVVAEAIHRHSLRSAGSFVPICVPALPSNLVESELFGHVKGAFTGATAPRRGLLAQADHGTAFFDEIGEIDLHVQVKLLRILELRQVQPVGSSQQVPCDFRLIAATNRDLFQRVREHQFREDLFYRLNVFHLHIPPLKQRRDDILPLAEHFLAQQKTAEPLGLSSATRDELLNRQWHGNVRELKHAMQYAAVMCRSGRIEPDDLPAPLTPNGEPISNNTTSLVQAVSQWTDDMFGRHQVDSDPVEIYQSLLETIEPVLFEATLRQTGGNRKQAAQILGLHRQTLREKMKRYGLDADLE